MIGQKFFNIWKQATKDRIFLIEMFATLIAMIAAVKLSTWILPYFEKRPGVILNDPILSLVGPYKLTWVTFSVLWISVLSAIALLIYYPKTIVIGFQAAALILVSRILTIYLIPLHPMPSIIPMADPLISGIGPSQILVNDLLYSGHTAVMFLLYLAVRGRRVRPLFLLGTVIVGVCVMLQHVHYSGDVLIAPFFAFACWKIANAVHERVERIQRPMTLSHEA